MTSLTTYELKALSIPRDAGWDVIVVGGGPSGCTAATAAAREGARTLLIEATGCLGGMGTSMVPCWGPFSDGRQIIYRGLAQRVFETTKKGMPHVDQNATAWVAIDQELLKRVYDDLVVGAGAVVRFNTFAGGLERSDDGHVHALIAASKAGLTALCAKVYVDCTGDADVTAWAGGSFHKGAPGTGEVQRATHCFMLSNVDEHGLRTGPRGADGKGLNLMETILRSGKFKRIVDAHHCAHLIGPGTLGCNSGHIWNVDGTDPAGVSAALIEGRKIAAEYRDALAQAHPTAFGNAFLAATANLLGVRESRRIVGDYVLTLEDYLARRSFPDEIGRNCYPIDIHNPMAELDSSRAGGDVMRRFENYKPGESHGIPYRCLTPKGLKNVLAAGRCISTDRNVQGSIRIMSACLMTGEAAGLAAALAAGSRQVDVHAVDAAELRRRLRAHGAHLP